MINDMLKKLYNRDLIVDANNRIVDGNCKAEGPLLIKINEANYGSAGKKIMMFGQENNGWTRGIEKNVTEKYITNLLTHYEKFSNGMNYKNKAIFHFMHKIAKELNIESDGFVYSNIWKYCSIIQDKKGKRRGVRPSNELKDSSDIINKFAFNEIEIIKPQYILFFTEPSYDAAIRRNIGEAKFTNFKNYTKNVIAEVSFKNLPVKCLRTYHPLYLRRKKLQERIYKEVIEFVSN